VPVVLPDRRPPAEAVAQAGAADQAAPVARRAGAADRQPQAEAAHQAGAADQAARQRRQDAAAQAAQAVRPDGADQAAHPSRALRHPPRRRPQGAGQR
jgi:hypothetical protein